jgi:hypothetical protein
MRTSSFWRLERLISRLSPLSIVLTIGSRRFNVCRGFNIYSLRHSILPTVILSQIGTDGRLTLPGQVIEDDESSAKYDIASGILSISLSKVNPGENFPDLDLTNRLLARTGEIVDDKKTVKGPPRIQIMDDTPSLDDTAESGNPWADGKYDDA